MSKTPDKDPNHLVFQLCHDIDELITPLKLAFGINFINMSRYYWLSKLTTGICSSEKFSRYWWNTKSYKKIDTILNPFTNDYNFIEDFDLDNSFGQSIIKPMRNRFDFYHIIIITKHYAGYSDVFVLAAPKKRDDFYENFLTHKDLIFDFLKYFKVQMKSQLSKKEELYFNLPTMKVSILKSKRIIQNKLLSKYFTNLSPAGCCIESNEQEVYLTQRESQIALLMAELKLAKQIANKLKISPITVQTHLDNIKKKLYCKNKKELIKKLIEEKVGEEIMRQSNIRKVEINSQSNLYMKNLQSFTDAQSILKKSDLNSFIKTMNEELSVF